MLKNKTAFIHLLFSINFCILPYQLATYVAIIANHYQNKLEAGYILCECQLIMSYKPQNYLMDNMSVMCEKTDGYNDALAASYYSIRVAAMCM